MRRKTTTTMTLALAAGMAMSAGAAIGQSTRDKELPPNYQRTRHEHQDQHTRDGMRDSDRQAGWSNQATRVREMSFYRADELIGEDVENPNDEDLGDVEDFVVDRGTGQIEYIIVEDGGFFGIGGERIAIPYSAFMFDPDEESFLLHAAPEEIERMGEYSRAGWVRLDSDDWETRLEDLWRNEQVQNKPDPFGTYDSERRNVPDRTNFDDRERDERDRRDMDERRNLRDGQDQRTTQDQQARRQTETIRGKVKSVERNRSPQGDEDVRVVLVTDDGSERRIVFGPSWYVMSQPNAPMRGDMLVVTAYRLDMGGGEPSWHAQRSEAGGNRIDLRDERGQPYWDARYRGRDMDMHVHERDPNTRNPAQDTRTYDRDSRNPDRDRDRVTDNQQRRDRATNPDTTRTNDVNLDNRMTTMRDYTPLVLLSEVLGRDVRARGDEDAGDIEDAVIEVNSGRVAFLVIDPDTNFLGMGDEAKIVPWTVLGVIGEDRVRMDADAAMLRNAQPLPEDVNVFRDEQRLRALYQPYGVDSQQFYQRSTRTGRMDGEGMVRDSREDKRLIDAMKHGQRVSISGRIAEQTSVRVGETGREMVGYRIETDRGARTVVIGPRQFVDRERLDLSRGDRVQIEARTCTMDNRELLMAHVIRTPDGERITLWEDGRPTWGGAF